MLRFIVSRIRNEFFAPPDEFDREFGIETRKTVWRRRLNVGKGNRGYQTVSPELFRQAASLVPRHTFIDLGCGKGRILILANQLGFPRVIGVERSSSLAKIALGNVSRLHIPAEIIKHDASSYQFPNKPIVVYMYNPFGRRTMEKVVANLHQHQFSVHVIYVQPEQEDVFLGFREISRDGSVLVLTRP